MPHFHAFTRHKAATTITSNQYHRNTTVFSQSVFFSSGLVLGSYTRFYRLYQQHACSQQAYLTYDYFRGFSPFNSTPKSCPSTKAPIGNAKGANPPPPSSPRPEDVGRLSSTTLSWFSHIPIYISPNNRHHVAARDAPRGAALCGIRAPRVGHHIHANHQANPIE